MAEAFGRPTERDYEALKPDRSLDEARKRGLITPFLPGTVISENSLVVDKHGVAWWVRPDSMTIIQAGPPISRKPATDDVTNG